MTIVGMHDISVSAATTRARAGRAAPHLVVVGAGIVGLGHAVAGLDAGYRVTVLEQDAAAVLASVRNFGHVCTSAQAGDNAALAWESNAIWRSLVERAGVDGRPSGTLVLARTAAEEAVLAELVHERPPRGARLITGHGAAAVLRLPRSAAVPRAAASLPGDLTADPRTAVARIAGWVDAQDRGDVRFRTTVHGIERTRHGIRVATSRGELAADHVVVGAGHLVGRLFPEHADDAEIRECALQMARVAAPHDMGRGPAVLTGTSMLRYGAFRGPAATALRAEIERERPDLIDIDANVMFTQQSDGTLLVGDSHHAHAAAPPFLDERCFELLLGEVASFLGVRRLRVLERWQGLYATSAKQEVYRAEPMAGVEIVTVTTGIGMTIGLALGKRTVDALRRPTAGPGAVGARGVPARPSG